MHFFISKNKDYYFCVAFMAGADIAIWPGRVNFLKIEGFTDKNKAIEHILVNKIERLLMKVF